MKHSQTPASVLLTLLAGGVLYGWLFWLPIDFHEDPFWPNDTGDVPRTSGFKAYAIAVRIAPLAALAGFVLGIAALIEREKYRLLAVLGLTANLLVLCASVGLMKVEESPRPFNERQLVGIGLEALFGKAEQGIPEAQNWLGEGYREGKGGLERNLGKAYRWHLLAAHNGHTESQQLLGTMYATGTGTPKNESRALIWFHRAARNGNFVAMHNLGVHYYHGVGTAPDWGKAINWFLKAAQSDDAHTQFIVGRMLLHGEGTEVDRPAAIEWLSKAAAQGHEKAQKMLEELMRL